MHPESNGRPEFPPESAERGESSIVEVPTAVPPAEKALRVRHAMGLYGIAFLLTWIIQIGGSAAIMVIWFARLYLAGRIDRGSMGLLLEEFPWGAFHAVLIGSELFGLLLPAWLFVRWRRLEARPALGLDRWALGALPGAILAGFGFTAWQAVFASVQEQWMPTPDELLRFMDGLLRSEGSLDGLLVLAGIVAAPALCEEVVFRGLILGALRERFGGRVAVVLSSVLFALIHQNLYQFLFVFLLGLFLAWLRLTTRSLLPCVAVHALNNALVVIAYNFQPAVPGDPATPISWPEMALAAAAFVSGTWWVRSQAAAGAAGPCAGDPRPPVS